MRNASQMNSDVQFPPSPPPSSLSSFTLERERRLFALIGAKTRMKRGGGGGRTRCIYEYWKVYEEVRVMNRCY